VKLFASLPPEWQLGLADQAPIINDIEERLNDFAIDGVQIVPGHFQIFEALQLSPAKVRVVIVGQDPYPNTSHACGLSFSVPTGTVPLPASLRNIVAELKSDVGDINVEDGDLSSWVAQGVLLLNRVLTTEAGKPGAHRHLGWQSVSTAIVRAVRQANPDVVGILWGKDALELRDEFASDMVVSSVHPSPLSSYRGFLGSKPFSRTNQLLVESGQLPIAW